MPKLSRSGYLMYFMLWQLWQASIKASAPRSTVATSVATRIFSSGASVAHACKLRQNSSVIFRKLFIIYSSVGEEHFGISTNYAAFVGANSFAHNSLNVLINSHLQTIQLRNLG